ncbi:6-chlorohydroxyquinol-1,2-dioxygenase [Steroidobacter agaridevorans]|uniref:6-chlorohydroxyquinol-1,2-dioxygenase n=1 Tax=Steroidobacter agaridevorans TaxID=2695856 RepID=A0A829YII0_9GAMM|nr:dioxygenase [Steroidobacter agaridevorans]GFE82316.1 6-chlorohydroxyquinol-1,2-dioxygenase [Steroidobacter agaridevorans]
MTQTNSNQLLLDQVIAAYSRTDNERWNTVIESLLRHLHGFANEVGLRPEEWWTAIDFLTRTGQSCVGPRQEFILLSDALGLSSAVDNLNNATMGGATESAVTGPFYAPHSPHIENGGSIALAGEGETVLIRGRVLATDGKPIAGAELDIWHTSPNQLYAVQDKNQPEMNFRGKLRTTADGGFAFRTIKPIAYPVPVDGPVGQLLGKAGRHPMRPAHIHFIVSAEGYRSVTTQLFTRGDEYIGSDAVFGVKDSLLIDYQRNTDRSLAVDWLLEHDFVLAG